MLNHVQQQLVLEHQELALALASRRKRGLPAHIDLDDLVSAAYLGLTDAASRFDGRRSFAAYATIRIWGSIQDYLRGQGVGRRGGNSRGIKSINQFAIDATGRSGEEYLEAKTRVDFDEITEGIPPLGRDLLRSYYVEGLRLKQIGARLGVGEARASQLLCQYRSLLREAV